MNDRHSFDRKLLVLDVEGTLFEAGIRLPGTSLSSTIWQGIAHLLGPDAVAAELETHRRWESGAFANYTSWMTATYEIHCRFGLSKDQFDSVIANAQYNLGVSKTFKSLDRNRYVPILITGGFRELARRAQLDFGIVHAFCGCEYSFDSSGQLVGANMLPGDFEGKLDFVRLMLREYGLDPLAWIFIGDGQNDVPVARAAPVAIGYKAHPDLRPYLTHDLEDFADLLSLL